MPLRAGVVYFLAVFAIGFVLGALRVMFIAPAVGPLWAVALELPFMLAASWSICGWLVRRFSVQSLADAAVTGAVAFALLMAAETALALVLGASTLDQVIASYGTPHGALGLAGQVAFGLFPLLRRRRVA
jgi:hypothetical protein